MKLNDDFSKPVDKPFADAVWVASPLAGVDRHMLDRIGDEKRARPPSCAMPGTAIFRPTHMMRARNLLSSRAHSRTRPAILGRALMSVIHRVQRTHRGA